MAHCVVLLSIDDMLYFLNSFHYFLITYFCWPACLFHLDDYFSNALIFMISVFDIVKCPHLCWIQSHTPKETFDSLFLYVQFMLPVNVFLLSWRFVLLTHVCIWCLFVSWIKLPRYLNSFTCSIVNIFGGVYVPLFSPTSDGAACVILASEDFVRRHGLESQAIHIIGQAMRTDTTSTFNENSSMKLVRFCVKYLLTAL